MLGRVEGWRRTGTQRGGGWALCRHLKSASAHKVDASMKDILIPL